MLRLYRQISPKVKRHKNSPVSTHLALNRSRRTDRMNAAHKFLSAQFVPDGGRHSSHDPHREHNVGAVSELDTNL